jgi:hypothetical protein
MYELNDQELETIVGGTGFSVPAGAGNVAHAGFSAPASFAGSAGVSAGAGSFGSNGALTTFPG